jgi:hypothetical protein
LNSNTVADLSPRRSAPPVKVPMPVSERQVAQPRRVASRPNGPGKLTMAPAVAVPAGSPPVPVPAAHQSAAMKAQEWGAGAESIQLDEHTEKELARIRREKEQRQKQFKTWDSLVQSEAFQDYLAARALRLYTPPPMPHNLDAECMTFGALFLLQVDPRPSDADIMAAAMARLRVPMFSLALRPVFEVISSLYYARQAGARTPCDPLIVAIELKKRDVGIDFAWLYECVTECPSPHNIHAYIDEIERCFSLRQLFALCVKGRDAVLESDADVSLITNALRNALEEWEGREEFDLRALFSPRK